MIGGARPNLKDKKDLKMENYRDTVRRAKTKSISSDHYRERHRNGTRREKRV